MGVMNSTHRMEKIYDLHEDPWKSLSRRQKLESSKDLEILALELPCRIIVKQYIYTMEYYSAIKRVHLNQF